MLETGFNGDFSFFFFFGGGKRWGWKFLTEVESDPKMAGVSISKGHFVKVMEPPENGREANGRAPSWSTRIVRCQFGALKHESLLTLIG